jgi:hypothetical protein
MRGWTYLKYYFKITIFFTKQNLSAYNKIKNLHPKKTCETCGQSNEIETNQLNRNWR